MNEHRSERLTWAQLTVFSLPVVLFQAIELPWRIYLPSFFSETLGLPLAAVGTLLMAIRLFDTVVDPPIGWASDRFPTRFGQRRPWMVAGVPLVMIGTWQVFFAAPGIGITTLAGWCLVMHFGYSLMLTPHGGWGLEIARDYHERTRIMGAKIWFAAAGMPLTILLPSILERGFGAGRAEQVGAMGLLLILLAPLSVLLVLRFIPEPPSDRAAAARAVGPFRLFGAILKDRELAIVLALYALVGLADASSSGTFFFFVEQVLGLNGWGSTLMLIPALVGLVTLPLWAQASRRLGKRRTLMGVFAWQALAAPLALLLPTGGLAPLAIYMLVRSACFGGDYMLLRSMVADISGRDAASGMRRSGSYYAFFNVTLKLASSLGVGAALWILATAGFVPGAPASLGAQEVIRLVYVLPTFLAGIAGLLILANGWREAPPVEAVA
ncbi:MFS transporter [Novosphingobium album (ex Liu et al. 2023)]|uniref:MFS transporter n=1 Tax=Novosphingobium album (ex Liu et al. 2023) TaxID=3031130 RepID=A0ABT5WN73_9SPHN|nr:MFS transporter [Novosphingobium album (ex Liu et al. 2023)]MDE8651502.1 MFS transporter [Novosphingobium album (ex Liu et al. 2023)]